MRPLQPKLIGGVLHPVQKSLYRHDANDRQVSLGGPDMNEGDHELDHESFRQFVGLLWINTVATALGAVAGWVALIVMLIVVLRE